MAAIGTLVFCTACGNLLDPSTGNAKNILTCAQCGTKNQGKSSLPPPLFNPPRLSRALLYLLKILILILRHTLQNHNHEIQAQCLPLPLAIEALFGSKFVGGRRGDARDYSRNVSRLWAHGDEVVYAADAECG